MVLHGVLGTSALAFPAALCKNYLECPRLCKRGTYV